MRGLGILILVIIFFWLIWPVIARWLKRKALEKAENYVRASMGMPPRDKKKTGNRETSESYYQRKRKNPFGDDRYTSEPIIPKEYAEDVEFTETKDFSDTQTRISKEGETKIYHESQISDAEWTEIKKPRVK